MYLLKKSVFIITFFALVLNFNSTYAQKVTVAVATNFISPMKRIITLFEQENNCKVIASYGSTGKLYAQIMKNAPFEIFLAADVKRPELLENKGKTVQGSRFTYASGKIALWSSKPIKVDKFKDVLAFGAFKHLALSNPKTAPYGYAAKQTIKKLDLTNKLNPKIVMGNNIGQTFQFVESGAADLGIVAYSQVLAKREELKGSFWVVPKKFYDPIEQQAVLLKTGKDNIWAYKFMFYLKSKPVVKVITDLGYSVK